MDNEIWKPIIGYEGLYEVSNMGRVKGLDRKDTKGRDIKGKILSVKQKHTENNQYLRVVLSKDDTRKTIQVHRLVAKAFVANVNNKQMVNHIDGNKLNNNAENLEWVTRSENAVHARDIGLLENTRRSAFERNSKKVIVKNIHTGEIREFKNRKEFSLSLGYNSQWLTNSIKHNNKKMYDRILEAGYELLGF